MQNKYNFTKREMEILPLLVMGLNNTEIAKRLFITCHTAKAHVSSIIKKLGVTNRITAAICIIKNSLL